MKKSFLMGLFLSVSLLLTTLVTPVAAADQTIDNFSGWSAIVDFSSKVVNTEGAHTTNFFMKVFQGILESMTAFILPEGLVYKANIQASDLPEYMKYGLAGMTENQVIAMFNSQPKVDVVAHLANEWVPGFEKTNSVYAAGYDDLMNAGISDIWSVTRNIAYIGFVIVMIVIGFMIMFRNKIGGQALVTLGNSIPRVIVSLILVTFSFAITGIIIDFGGVLMQVVTSTLGSNIQVYNPVELFLGFLGQNAGYAATTGGLGITAIVLGIVGAITGGTGVIVGTVIVFILTLIVAGIVIWGAIKLWIVLIKSYLTVLLNVVIAPIAIMFGALPGNDAAIGNIFKSILRGVLVFPLAFAIVNLPYFFEEHGFSLIFPESLAKEGVGGVSLDFFIQIAKVVAIYAAASAPSILMGIIPSTVSKSAGDAAGAIKASLQGVPFIGGMFK
ncbi:hypothetical protein GYA44_01380 [Candidatus Microgenomates bacterium]|nr:hypothetical protein [Candidatus Microgenomates bacterium]